MLRLGRHGRRTVSLVTLAIALWTTACGGRVLPPPSSGSLPPVPKRSVSPTTTATTTAKTSAGGLGIVATGPSLWLTYHGDAAHSGQAPGQPAVGTITRAWRTTVDGAVYAEPLVDGSTVIVATEHDTVYALDAGTGGIRWKVHLGDPVPGSSLPCGNIDQSGITGTPVIDAAGDEVWAVTFTAPAIHQLVAIDLDTGVVRSRRTIRLPGVDGRAEQERGALALAHGMVYIPFGGLYGDCGQYRGMVVGMATHGDGGQETFIVPTSREGAIWAPAGPVVNSTGDLLVATGNGSSGHRYDEGDSVLRLSPALVQEGSFAPSNWAHLNEADLDLGSTSPVVVSPDRLVQVGKGGTAYLLATDRLGGIGGQLTSLQVCPSEAVGGTAVDGSTVIVPCTAGLTALQVGPGDRLTRRWATSLAGGAPVVSAGRIWAVTPGGHLVSIDERSGNLRLDVPVGAVHTSFPSLAIAGGHIFVPTDRGITAFSGV